MVQVRRSNLLENVLAEHKNALLKQFFENGFQDPNQEVIQMFHSIHPVFILSLLSTWMAAPLWDAKK